MMARGIRSAVVCGALLASVLVAASPAHAALPATAAFTTTLTVNGLQPGTRSGPALSTVITFSPEATSGVTPATFQVEMPAGSRIAGMFRRAKETKSRPATVDVVIKSHGTALQSFVLTTPALAGYTETYGTTTPLLNVTLTPTSYTFQAGASWHSQLAGLAGTMKLTDTSSNSASAKFSTSELSTSGQASRIRATWPYDSNVSNILVDTELGTTRVSRARIDVYQPQTDVTTISYFANAMTLPAFGEAVDSAGFTESFTGAPSIAPRIKPVGSPPALTDPAGALQLPGPTGPLTEQLTSAQFKGALQSVVLDATGSFAGSATKFLVQTATQGATLTGAKLKIIQATTTGTRSVTYSPGPATVASFAEDATPTAIVDEVHLAATFASVKHTRSPLLGGSSAAGEIKVIPSGGGTPAIAGVANFVLSVAPGRTGGPVTQATAQVGFQSSVSTIALNAVEGGPYISSSRVRLFRPGTTTPAITYDLGMAETTYTESSTTNPSGGTISQDEILLNASVASSVPEPWHPFAVGTVGRLEVKAASTSAAVVAPMTATSFTTATTPGPFTTSEGFDSATTPLLLHSAVSQTLLYAALTELYEPGTTTPVVTDRPASTDPTSFTETADGTQISDQVGWSYGSLATNAATWHPTQPNEAGQLQVTLPSGAVSTYVYGSTVTVNMGTATFEASALADSSFSPALLHAATAGTVLPQVVITEYTTLNSGTALVTYTLTNVKVTSFEQRQSPSGPDDAIAFTPSTWAIG